MAGTNSTAGRSHLHLVGPVASIVTHESSNDSFQRRLIAILDYDGIAPERRTARVAAACGCSPATARRLLEGNPASKGNWAIDLSMGLDVSLRWLWDGEFERVHPRTFRIHAQTVKGFPKEDVDLMMRLLVGSYAEHRKAGNLISLVNRGYLTLHRAAQLL